MLIVIFLIPMFWNRICSNPKLLDSWILWSPTSRIWPKMEISSSSTMKLIWSKLNSKFYQNNFLIKPQYMPMLDKLKTAIKPISQDQQYWRQKTSPFTLNGGTQFQVHIFYQLITITHLRQARLLLRRCLWFHTLMVWLQTHHLTVNLRLTGR